MCVLNLHPTLLFTGLLDYPRGRKYVYSTFVSRRVCLFVCRL